MTKEFNFSCNACGKCCNSPPVVNLAEVIKYADDFVYMFTLVPVFSADPENMEYFSFHEEMQKSIFPYVSDKAITDTVLQQNAIGKAFGFKTAVPDMPQGIYLIPLFCDIADLEPSCLKLTNDNKCSIYENRPGICRFAPLNSNMCIRMAAEVLPEDLSHAIQNQGFECETGPDAAPFIKNNKFLDKSYEENFIKWHTNGPDWAKTVKYDELIKNTFKLIARYQEDIELELLADILSLSLRGESIQFSFSFFIVTLSRLGAEGKFIASNLIYRQINAIKKRLEQAMKNGTLDDKLFSSITHNPRTQIETFMELLQEYEKLEEIIV